MLSNIATSLLAKAWYGLLSLVFDNWIVTAVVVGLLVALAWKVYRILGWRGLVAVVGVIVTFFIYRAGWRGAVQAHQYDKFPTQPDRPKPREIEVAGPTPPVKETKPRPPRPKPDKPVKQPTRPTKPKR